MITTQSIEALAALYQQLAKQIPKSQRYHRQDAIFLLLVECALGLIPLEYATILKCQYFNENVEQTSQRAVNSRNTELNRRAIDSFVHCLNR